MERSQFKQRIIGGLVLVALGAIVIPFLLNMHQEDQWWGKGDIPKKPENGFVTRVLPLEEWSKQAHNELAEGAKQMNTAPPPAPSETSAPPSSPTPAAPVTASKPASTPPSAAAVVSEGWVVQLASFSSEKSAEDLRDRLLKKGYRAFVERLKQGSQTVYRVRIGPEPERAAADTLRDRVAHDLKLKAIVLPFP